MEKGVDQWVDELYRLSSILAAMAGIVIFPSSKFGLLMMRCRSLGIIRYRLHTAFLLLLLGLVSGSAIAGAERQNASATPIGLGPQFAIADFDGDLSPDLARIEAGPSSSGATSYWVQLQLSAAGRQTFRLVAPSGGLLIEARDVNGDNAVDLVFATAWFKRPVAIFLNDGHGGFSQVETSAFPGAFNESTTNWALAPRMVTETLGVLPQSRANPDSEASGLLHHALSAASISLWNAMLPVNPFLKSQGGRGPPTEVLRF